MSYNERNAFVFQCITRQYPKNIKKLRTKSKQYSNTYHLKDEFGADAIVSKTFFLTTLGFDKKNDSLITTILSDSSIDLLTPKLDRRGTNFGNKRLDHQEIRNHEHEREETCQTCEN